MEEAILSLKAIRLVLASMKSKGSFNNESLDICFPNKEGMEMTKEMSLGLDLTTIRMLYLSTGASRILVTDLVQD